MEQIVQNERPTPLKGVGIVALTAALVLAGARLFGWLEQWIGQSASLLFILYGILIALLLMNRYVMGYHYAANDDLLRVSHSYGRYRRFLCDVWLNRVTAWGAPAEMRERFPGAKVTRAVKPRCPIEPLALAYRTSDGLALLVIQPDDALRAHLLSRIKKKK